MVIVRRLTVVFAVAVVSLLALAPVGQATQITFFDSSLSNFNVSPPGPRHSLMEIFGQNLSGLQVGVYALNTDGTPAGTTAHAYGTVTHSYNGTTVRYPYVQSYESGTYYYKGIESY